ncbi:unnamed protein product [Bursaphelenchus xylophilus]|uniref:(pine wood nematode) hypothetical protein n=1 Tax=Bursaphelenchus xylophilus TaxID=6326 RepID=A0A1I7RT95_BURXY|nr:unnamed protein product [Bursaphelenchus xylophilus]CAG9122530.1 unnamed protein product [Bursaphelenchus xylophilus]
MDGIGTVQRKAAVPQRTVRVGRNARCGGSETVQFVEEWREEKARAETIPGVRPQGNGSPRPAVWPRSICGDALGAGACEIKGDGERCRPKKRPFFCSSPKKFVQLASGKRREFERKKGPNRECDTAKTALAPGPSENRTVRSGGGGGRECAERREHRQTRRRTRGERFQPPFRSWGGTSKLEPAASQPPLSIFSTAILARALSSLLVVRALRSHRAFLLHSPDRTFLLFRVHRAVVRLQLAKSPSPFRLRSASRTLALPLPSDPECIRIAEFGRCSDSLSVSALSLPRRKNFFRVASGRWFPIFGPQRQNASDFNHPRRLRRSTTKLGTGRCDGRRQKKVTISRDVLQNACTVQAENAQCKMLKTNARCE